MAEGQIVFQGTARKAVNYFSKIGYQIPSYSNPADHFIKTLSVSYPKTSADIDKLDYFNHMYDQKIHKKLKRSFVKKLDDAKNTIITMQPKKRSFLFQQIKQLLLRNTIALSRNPAALLGRIVISIFVSLVSLVLFWDKGRDIEKLANPSEI